MTMIDRLNLALVRSPNVYFAMCNLRGPEAMAWLAYAFFPSFYMLMFTTVMWILTEWLELSHELDG